MTPESAAYIGKARLCLSYAQTNLSVGLGNDAGRNAYLAAFHVAQALIFERTGRVAKTHTGVSAEFNRLLQGAQLDDPALRSLLARTYAMKAVADYEFGPDAIIPPERAAAALEEAGRLVDTIEALLTNPAGPT